ncbi:MULTISPECIES: hypothetical protein [Bradyrhizobium]|uniref:hypothetical protein n=1 Tax=Bradyrhizobium TaxID=374 RepID=UPI001FCE2DEF|nr:MULTISPECIES: hypothetical protein [Bradyrhizobium]
MASNLGNSTRVTAAERHLVEDKAIYTDFRARMNDDAVRMGDKKPPPNLASKRDIRTRNDAPEPVTNNQNFAVPQAKNPATALPELILSDGKEKFSSGIPKMLRDLSRPIGDLGTDLVQLLFHCVYSIRKMSKNSKILFARFVRSALTQKWG